MQAVIESLIGTPWWLFAFLAIYGVCWSVYSDIADKDNKARGRWLVDLRENRWLRRYRETLGSALDQIDARLTPDMPRKKFPPVDVQIAWSSGLLGLTLVLAVAYPAAAVLGQWAVTGGEVRAGPLTLFEASASEPVRYLMIALASAACICAFLAMEAQSKPKQLALALTVWVFALAFTLSFSGAEPSANVVSIALVVALVVASAFVIAVTVAFAAAYVLSVAGAGALAGAIAFTATVVFGVTFILTDAHALFPTVALAGAFAVAVAVTGADASAFAGAVAVAVAVAFAIASIGADAGALFIAVVIAGAVAQRMVSQMACRPALLLFVYAALLLLSVVTISAIGAPRTVVDWNEFRAMLVFLGVLPILNALSDFLSIGMTRWTMRRGLAEDAWIWLWMLIDLVAGLVILLALGASIVAVTHLARLGDGAPLLALEALFADLRVALGAAPPPEADARISYAWLYVMLLTTLAPTAAHLIFASFGGVLQLWPWLRRHIAEGLEAGAAGDRVLGRWAVQWMCLAMTLAVAIPVVIIGALWRNADAIGRALLAVMEAWARLIGAI